MGRTVDLVGSKFGRWTVVSREPNRFVAGCYRSCYLCRCECGEENTVLSQSLKNGSSASCGCLKRDTATALCLSRTTHGHSRKGSWSMTYKSWNSMMTRVKRDPYYVAFGIQVCERWTVFENFLTDMGERPSKKHSVDRVKNELGYFPGNCRWATAKEQANNRRPRGTVLVTSPETAEHRKWRGEQIRRGKLARKMTQ